MSVFSKMPPAPDGTNPKSAIKIISDYLYYTYEALEYAFSKRDKERNEQIKTLQNEIDSLKARVDALENP